MLNNLNIYKNYAELNYINEFYANQFMNTSTELLAGPTMKQV
jgi:hypothetical protein